MQAILVNPAPASMYQAMLLASGVQVSGIGIIITGITIGGGR